MYINYKIKQFFQNITTTDLFQQLLCFKDKSIGTILMLHRIDNIDYSRFMCNEHLKISPDFLESLILSFRKKGYSFVSIDELHDVLRLGKDASKLIVITLDDGYQDNFTNGLPIFKKHSVPFTVYVSTGMVEKELVYWWYLLEDLITRNDEIILSDGSKYVCKSKKNKELTFLKIRDKIIKIHPDNFRTALPQLFAGYHIDLNEYNNILQLTWEQINILIKEPLATIGSHTHSHIGLNFNSVDKNILDIEKANLLFKEKADHIPKHFCYPYGGSITEKETCVISDMGFKTAVTTNVGNIYRKNADNLFLLPRVFVSENSNPDLFSQMTWLKYQNK